MEKLLLDSQRQSQAILEAYKDVPSNTEQIKLGEAVLDQENQLIQGKLKTSRSPQKLLPYSESQLDEFKKIDYSPSGKSPLTGTV